MEAPKSNSHTNMTSPRSGKESSHSHQPRDRAAVTYNSSTRYSPSDRWKLDEAGRRRLGQPIMLKGRSSEEIPRRSSLESEERDTFETQSTISQDYSANLTADLHPIKSQEHATSKPKLFARLKSFSFKSHRSASVQLHSGVSGLLRRDSNVQDHSSKPSKPDIVKKSSNELPRIPIRRAVTYTPDTLKPPATLSSHSEHKPGIQSDLKLPYSSRSALLRQYSSKYSSERSPPQIDFSLLRSHGEFKRPHMHPLPSRSSSVSAKDFRRFSGVFFDPKSSKSARSLPFRRNPCLTSPSSIASSRSSTLTSTDTGRKDLQKFALLVEQYRNVPPSSPAPFMKPLPCLKTGFENLFQKKFEPSSSPEVTPTSPKSTRNRSSIWKTEVNILLQSLTDETPLTYEKFKKIWMNSSPSMILSLSRKFVEEPSSQPDCWNVLCEKFLDPSMINGHTVIQTVEIESLSVLLLCSKIEAWAIATNHPSIPFYYPHKGVNFDLIYEFDGPNNLILLLKKSLKKIPSESFNMIYIGPAHMDSGTMTEALRITRSGGVVEYFGPAVHSNLFKGSQFSIVYKASISPETCDPLKCLKHAYSCDTLVKIVAIKA